MSFVETLRDFQTLGCEDQTKCALAARVYLDLLNDRRVFDLERHYDADLKLIYLRAVREGNVVIFVPILSSQSIDLKSMECTQTKLAGNNSKSITLAICDTASTILYYQISGELLEKP